MDNKEIKTNGGKLNIRVLVKLLLIGLLFLGTLFTRMYIVKEMHHECTGDHCEICGTIATARRTLDSLDAVGAISLAIIIIHYLFIKKIYYFIKNIIEKSPVKLKVRLRNWFIFIFRKKHYNA